MTAQEAAWAAFEAGLCVLPPTQDGAKRPDVDSWTEYQLRRSKADELTAWYVNGRTGVGILCGAVSGGVEMLEFEGRAVAEGLHRQFRELADAAGLGELLDRIQCGYTESTPRGGYHLIYKVPTPQGNTKLASRPATAEELEKDPKNKIQVLIETRGEGGYCIVAPSNGRVHPEGGAWQLVAGGFDTIATISNDERDELFDLARLLDQMPQPPPQSPGESANGDRPGDFFNAAPDIQERILELLERHSWTRVYSKGQAVYLRRPGKDRGISASLGYVAPGVFRNFSTSAEVDARAFSAFSIYALLEHGGDYSAAASALQAEGFGADYAYHFNAASTDMPPEPEPVAGWPEPPDEAVYHGLAGDLVRAVQDGTEADPVAILGTILVTFGVLAGDWRMLYQGQLQAARLYVLLVGDTAIGRKGTAASIARVIFDLAVPGWESVLVPGLGSGEGLIGLFTRREEKAAESGRAPDVRALVTESEYGRLLAIANRQGSTLSPILRDAYDGSVLGRNLAREGAIVARHHVGLIGHITAAELRARLTEVDTVNGYANRHLFVAVRRPRLVPFPENPTELVRGSTARLREAIEAAWMPGEMKWTADAHDRWESFYRELALWPRYGLIGKLTARTESHVARVAFVYALIARCPDIGLAHLEAAIAFVDYAERSARFVFGDSTGNRHADALRRMLADGEVEWKQAKGELGLRTAADLAEAVEILVSEGLAEVVKNARPTGGRALRIIRAKGAKSAKGA